MRLAYTADLHGDIGSYHALLELAVASGARVAIVGGDLFPHTPRLQDAIRRQRDFVEQALGPLLAAFHVRHPEVRVYLLPGNDDWAAAAAALAELEAAGLAHTLHERVYELAPAPSASGAHVGAGRAAEVGAGLWLAGYACVPPTPFSIKDYERRDDGPLPAFSFAMAYTSAGGAIVPTSAVQLAALPSIAEALEALARQSDPARTVYVCHTPPFDTPLDAMPRGRHVGSRALRAFVERHTPPLTLHGHIHEAPEVSGQYAVRLGRTWCINPGHDRRRFHAVTLDTDDIEGTISHTVFGRPASGGLSF
ncbi:MAG TPA: metallophosphoesterase [Roseiflexaceae bacterium]|nr:metallophosphoesterase [Roseiflexaceae bacterium]